MMVFRKHKSRATLQSMLVLLAMTTSAAEAATVEVAGLFQNGPKVAQAPAPAEAQPTVPVKPVDETVCKDTSNLYLTISATHNTRQQAAEALIETIYRHETMQRLVAIAAAAGCGMRPFVDEEVRRNKR
jgi:adenylate kinase